jgi:hypothetical protein
MALSPSAIAQFKAIYGPLFKVTRGNNSYTCRTINRAEAKAVGLLEAERITHEIEDKVFLIAVLDPEFNSFDDIEGLPANDVPEVVAEVLKRSGLLDHETVNDKMEYYRRLNTIDVYAMISSVIISAMPHYTHEQLDTLPSDKLFDLLAKAEQINDIKQSIILGEYGPLSFITKTPPAEQSQQPALSDADQDAIIRQKLMQGAMQAGLVDGSFQEKQFGIRNETDKARGLDVQAERETFESAGRR